jgi:hypothetical protein
MSDRIRTATLDASAQIVKTKGPGCPGPSAAKWAIQDSNLGPLPYQ